MKNNEPKCLHIHNIYREAVQGNITELLNLLNSLLKKDLEGQHLMIEDLNLHHPTWGGLNIKKDRKAEQLLTVMNERQLSLLLPQESIIWRAGKLQNMIDLSLGTPTMTQRLVSCEVMKKNYNLDHHPVLTTLLLETLEATPQTRQQWDKLNMEIFWKALTAQLTATTSKTMEQQVKAITETLQHIIQEAVPVVCPSK